MRKNNGITLITLIIYIILTLLVLGMLSVLGMNFRKNLNNTNEQTIRDIEFDKLNLQLLKETKTEGNVINESESNSTKIVFSNGNVYTYNEAEQTVYLNENIKIAEHIEACTFEINSIETNDETFNETRSYTDKNGDIAVIPAGFMVSGLEDEQTIDTGLVIYEAVPTKKQRLNVTVKVNDVQRVTEYVLISESGSINWQDGASVANAQKTYDQFVWIPISHEQINNMYICQAKTTSNGKCNIQVVNGEAKCTSHNSTLMAGRLYATDTEEKFEQGYTEVYDTTGEGLREPDVVTHDGDSEYLTYLSSILGTTGYDTMENFKQSLQEEYNEVVKSVYENQGFYMGRYETSNMVAEKTNATVKIVAGTTTGISGVPWYMMYAQQKKYAENNGLTSVKSTMIQGAAYDQVMKFVENGKRPDGKTYTIKTEGNVGHDRDYIDGPWQTGGLNYASSTPYNDKVKNIYDLEGNVDIWTTEAYSSTIRINRGGFYTGNYSASCRSFDFPPFDGPPYHGSCLMLYIIQEQQTTHQTEETHQKQYSQERKQTQPPNMKTQTETKQ